MTAACEFCGQPDATKVGDQYICDACYIARGSCCAEWFEEDTDERHLNQNETERESSPIKKDQSQ